MQRAARALKPESPDNHHRLSVDSCIQPKLTIGEPGDKFEKEADAVADQVMMMPSPKAETMPPVAEAPTVQLMPVAPPAPEVQMVCEECEEENVQMMPASEPSIVMAAASDDDDEDIRMKGETDQLQMKCAQCEEEEKLQMKCAECEAEEKLQMKCAECEEEEKIQMKCAECEEEEKIQMKCAECEDEEKLQMKCAQCEEEEKVQMKCAECEEEEKLQMQHEESEEEEKLQMKCAECEKEEQAQAKVEQPRDEHYVSADTQVASSSLEQQLRSGRGQGRPLAETVNEEISSKMGADFSGVRVHTDSTAREMNNELRARAFTYGSDIYFNSGEYNPENSEGKRLLAHELTHVVQQGAAPSTEGGRVRRSMPEGDIQRYSWDEFVSDLGDTADTLSGAARQTWDTAQAIGRAVVGSVSVSGTTMTITLPAKNDVCPIIPLRFNLPEIGKDIPFFVAALPLAPNVEVYGTVGLHIGLTPEVSFQIGPCSFGGGTITADLLSGTFRASGGGSATVAVGVGAELRVGLRGEVGLIIIVPAGPVPVPIQIPVAGLEAGLAGFARATASDSFEVAGTMAYSGTSATLNQSSSHDFGLGIDYGLAGYGGIDVLGQNLCTVYWPFIMEHTSATLSVSESLDVEVGTGGFSVDFEVSEPSIDAVPYDELPVALGRDMFSDDCPLCDFFERAGLMPSNYGGNWSGHPGGAWTGPLADVYKRDPGIASGAKCRGACGPDCDTCNAEEEKIVCHDIGNGKHEFWRYPNYTTCNSHQGCRDHDGCYDWCASGGGIASSAIIFPCMRLCDFEAMCDYGFQQSVGWISGGTPHDSVIHYSDKPEKIGECSGPCQQQEGEDGQPVWKICLPENITLFKGLTRRKEFPIPPKQVTLFSKGIEVPYLGLGVNLVRVYAFARFAPPPFVQGEIGPAELADVCVIYNPATKSYSGQARLVVHGRLSGQVTIQGGIGVAALEGKITDCLRLSALDGEGSLSATGRVELPMELSDDIEVKCEQGEIQMINSINFNSCLRLMYELRAHVLARVLGFEVYKNSWHLTGGQWERCWNTNLAVIPIKLGVGGSAVTQGIGTELQGLGAGPNAGTQGGAGSGTAGNNGAGNAPATPVVSDKAYPELSVGNIDAVDLIKWLLSDSNATNHDESVDRPTPQAASANGANGEGEGEDDPCKGVKDDSKPIGEWTTDFYHYSPNPISGDFKKPPPGYQQWITYHTNCAAEAKSVTGIPQDPRYVTSISRKDAVPNYIDDNNFQTAHRYSIIYGRNLPFDHYANHTAIPQRYLRTSSLSIYSADCK